MDYEKAYKEACEKAKGIINYYKECNRDEAAIEDLEQIFPELKESEDERIKKDVKRAISVALDYSYFDKETANNCLAWVEKQGNTDLEFFENSENEKREFVGYGFLKCKGDFLSFKEGENYWLEYVGKDNYNVRSDNLLGQTFHITPQQLYTVFRPTTWLEKQGKSIKIKKGKNYLCTKTHKYAGLEWIEGIKYYSPEDYALVNQGCICHCPEYSKEKHNNFFKEVEYDGCLEVEDAEQKPTSDTRYEVKADGSLSVSASDYKYATITQKDFASIKPKFNVGDWIIFNGFIIHIDEVVDGYYRTTTFDGIPNSYSWNIDNVARLWTIQDAKDGDMLAEDTCIFIIQKLGDNSTAAKTYCTLYNDGDFDDGTILYFDIDSTKPATKEQRDLLFQEVKKAGYAFDFEKKELKKIEDEIDDDKVVIKKGEKPSDWSEEDEEEFEIAIETLHEAGQHSSADWLKSLKDRITWKPSEEQIHAFEQVYEWYNNNIGPSEALTSLYNDLKKL